MRLTRSLHPLGATVLFSKGWIGLLAVLLLSLVAVPQAAVGQSDIIISQYVDTESGTTPKGIELWNVSGSSIDFSSNPLVVNRYANGSSSATEEASISSGTLADGEVLVIGGSDMETHMNDNAPNVRFINDSFSFNGDDALEILLDGNQEDVFGTIGTDPGSAWTGNGVSTADQNIQLLSGVTDGSNGFTDPSTRFETRVDNPSGSGDLDGFGTPPASSPTVQFLGSSGTVAEGDGSMTLTIEISNPDGNSVDVDVEFDAASSSASAGDIGNYSTQTVSFSGSASDGDTKTVSVSITDDSESEGTETATFNLTNLSTSGDASIGSPSQFDLDITDNDPTVQFTSSSATVAEGDGSTNLTVEISNPDGNSVDVDVEFDAGSSSASAGDIGNYSTQTVSFSGSASDGDTKTVSVSITDDSESEGTETATFNLTNLSTSGGASIAAPSQFDLDITDNDAQIIISQYVDTESGTTPKGLELRNVSGSTIDFSSNTLVVNRYTNGDPISNPTEEATVTTGTLADGEVMVIGGSDVQTHMTNNFPGVQFINDSFTFNGDDALDVRLGGDQEDVFGTIGTDPGSAWTGNGVSTADQNIQLKSGTTNGSDGFTDPSTRFETVIDNPTGSGDLKGFGTATDVVAVNAGGTGNDTFFPCDISPDASDISSGLNQVGANDNVFVCPGSYSESSPDIQTFVRLATNADATISDQVTLSSGTFDVESGSLTLESTSETSTAAIAGTGSGSVRGDVTFQRQLNASGDHFRFLSAPTATLLDAEGSGSNAGNLLSNMWTQSSGTDTGADAEGSSVDPSVFTYDEGFNIGNNEDLSDGWTGVTTLNSGNGDFSPGTGFLAFLFADLDPPAGDGDEGFPQTLTATGTVQAEENDGSAIDLSSQIAFTNDDDTNAQNGWNLIANPFMAPIDWESIENDGTDLDDMEATIYVWDAAAGQYATYTANSSGDSGGSSGGSGNQDQFIAPFQAFFVKATGSGSGGNGPDIGGIESGDKDTGQSPEFKSNETATPQISLRLCPEGDSTGETTAFRYAEDASPDKDPFDAFQLEPFGTTRTLVASEMSGTDALFDHQNRPAPAEVDTVDLALDITESDTYVLEADTLENLPSDWNVVLENTDSGTQYDVDAGESVTFEVTAPESAPKTASASSSAAAMLKNGGPTVATAKSSGDLPSFRLLVGPSSAIPVELASFDATTEGPEVQLSWQTASETNNAGFAVERRVGARGRGSESAWTQVGFVEGAGTTEQAQTYRFTDAEVPFEAEQVRYRLRQQDLDGTTSLSDEVTVELGAPSKARLHAPFPNPSAQQATVRYKVPQQSTVEIAVYDVLGRRVETIVDGQVPAGREQRTVQTAQRAPGTYFVRMRIGDTVQTQRLTIVR